MDDTNKTENINKKKSKLPFIITLIIVILVFGTATILHFTVFNPKADTDIAIVKLINENAKAKGTNSYEAYKNAKDVGYVLDDLTLSKESRVILWDSVNDVYVLYDGNDLVYSPIENTSEGTSLWIFVSKPLESSKFSVYSTEIIKIEAEESAQKAQEFSNHVYNITTSGDNTTYTCTEDFGTLAHDHCTLCGKNFIDGVEKTDDELKIAKKTGPSGTPIYNTSASANANSGVVFTNLSSDKDYYLAEDITLTGGSSSDVEIEASNINIDLNGKKISMSSSGADLAFKGANVKISNGTISSSNMRLYPKNTGFELDGVTVNNSSKDGIKFDYSSKDYVATIRNCNITGSATSGTRGAIVITNGTLNIYDSTLKANNPSSGATTVVLYPYGPSDKYVNINVYGDTKLIGSILLYNKNYYNLTIESGTINTSKVTNDNIYQNFVFKGGTYSFNPSNVVDKNSTSHNYVPSGYKVQSKLLEAKTMYKVVANSVTNGTDGWTDVQ